MSMQYRKFGKLDFQVSALGFGTMRLPCLDNQGNNINLNEAAKMIHYAIDHGVNYIDTAYPYHEGFSETAVGQILKQATYRSKVKIATKQPIWLIQEPGDADKFLNEQLEKLETDHIDFYLFHALFTERWKSVNDFRLLEWAEKAIQQGKIGHIGFSIHDGFDLFKEVVDAYDKWDFCQIQYNYVNEDVQVGTEGLKYAADKGLAVVVMEPLLGGTLANPPANIQEAFARENADPVDIALRWLWDKPEVSCVLSGMSNMEQVEHNIEIANRSGIHTLKEHENLLVKEVLELHKANSPVPCTKCKYCMPCPNGVNIPYNIELYNEAKVHNKYDLSKPLYNWHIPEANKAAMCTQCGLCEDKCPQKIAISQWMPKIHSELVIT